MSVSRRSSNWATDGSVLALAGTLFFVDLFLPWTQGCNAVIQGGVGGPLPGPLAPSSALLATFFCSSQANGWGGAGTVAGVLAALLVLWEATRVARVGLGVGVGYRSLISAGLGFGVLLFTIVDVAALLTWTHSTVGPLLYGGTFVWIGLALAIVIAALGLVHWRIWQAHAPGLGPASAESVSIPPERPPIPPGQCPSCGHANPAEARFCSDCGTSLSRPAPQRPSPRRPPPAG
ncbi:MAG TPA: zinc ribbon domain-containing protein [Candidatus Dormibacteraeota bacterium]|nr:zinc ribbon domain-containing protein [Candidatus Dormibacteraeota bacterium]